MTRTTATTAKKKRRTSTTTRTQKKTTTQKKTQKATPKAEAKPATKTRPELNIVCDRSILNDYLDFVAKGVPQNPSHAILNNVLFVADAAEQKLHLTTYNLQFGMSVSFAATVNSPGAMTLPLDAFRQMIGKFPQGDISLECKIVEPTEPEEEPALAAILSTPSDRDKRFEFRGMVEDDFPNLPRVETKLMTLPASLLLAQLSGSLFAASTQEDKKILNGSHFYLSCDPERKLDSLRTWTTNGHRLALMEGKTESKSQTPLAEPVSFTVPLKVLRELERNLDPTDKVTLYFEKSETSETQGGTAIFEWNEKCLVTATLEGQYPDCEGVVQPLRSQYCRAFTVERVALLKTLERFVVLSDKSAKAVTLRLESETQKAYLSIEHKEVGKGEEALGIQMKGEDVEFKYDVRYFLEVVKAISTSDLRIHLASPETPTLIVPYGTNAKGEVPIAAEYILAPLY
ncbi:DNA polymerase III subunit beta [Spirulina sp. 06S082]|uniref:DNA polymerase III subunit beta n=1 Tax=Spirulina sp. 06S082 TaxID=3110248 RepID=UPI002B1F8492|nr:DNA polymerase III subunit beta [Spirulina sp. 06S082]MEA5468581.1 DNA polymerase III subunit beta [Spirulina sp. 06S082]